MWIFQKNDCKHKAVPCITLITWISIIKSLHSKENWYAWHHSRLETANYIMHNITGWCRHQQLLINRLSSHPIKPSLTQCTVTGAFTTICDQSTCTNMDTMHVSQNFVAILYITNWIQKWTTVVSIKTIIDSITVTATNQSVTLYTTCPSTYLL